MDFDLLINKLQQCRFGSRDLDADVYEAFGYRVKRARTFRENNWGTQVGSVAYRYFDERYRRWCSTLNVTSSIDDAQTFWANHLKARTGYFVDATVPETGIEVTICIGEEEFKGTHTEEEVAHMIAAARAAAA